MEIFYHDKFVVELKGLILFRNLLSQIQQLTHTLHVCFKRKLLLN